ncbi:hypothetical protein D9M71_514280 [compost metagenome]
MTRHGLVGQRIGGIQVGGGADDAVELAAELQLAAENAPVHGQVGRCLVGEIDADRVPVRTEQGGAEAVHHGDRQLDGLAAVDRHVGDHFLANDHGLAVFFDEDRQGVVDQMAVLHDHLQGLAQGALVAEQQADLAEIRQLAQFGHAQAERLAAADVRRLLEQVDGGGNRYALGGIAQLRGAEARLGQHVLYVQAQVAGDFRIVGENGSTG